MTEVQEVVAISATELLGTGRRHLAVRDYNSAAEVLAKACEMVAKEHGDTADQCAEAYLWYGKSLLGLFREESGVLGDKVPGPENGEVEDDEDDENGDNEKNDEADKSDNDEEGGKDDEEQIEGPSTSQADDTQDKKEDEVEQTGTSNGEGADDSAIDLPEEDDVDNLQLAWEMLDLARSILLRRVESGGGDTAQSLLADVHLSLGEVALESETYDKAVIDMMSCLQIQKKLYQSDDRRIAETHYQIGLANSLSSNFEEAITHFKNAANIIETRIKKLEDPASANDERVKKYSDSDPLYSIEGEVKELKELLPEIREKIQDMMDYKAETIRRLREALCPTNGAGASAESNGASSSSAPKQVTNISHLVKRKRKSSENVDGEGSAPKRSNT